VIILQDLYQRVTNYKERLYDIGDKVKNFGHRAKYLGLVTIPFLVISTPAYAGNGDDGGLSPAVIAAIAAASSSSAYWLLRNRDDEDEE